MRRRRTHVASAGAQHASGRTSAGRAHVVWQASEEVLPVVVEILHRLPPLNRRVDGGGEAALERLQDVRVGRCGDDVLRVVDEVQDEGVLLARSDTVQPGQRLDGLHIRELLVQVHRVEQRLVVASLVLLRDDQDLVVVSVEPLRQLLLPEPVEQRFAVGDVRAVGVDAGAGERDQGPQWVVTLVLAFLLEVLGDGLVVSHRVKA